MNAGTRLFIDVAAELCQQGATPAQAVQTIQGFVTKHPQLVVSLLLQALKQADLKQAQFELEQRFLAKAVQA